MKILLSIFLSIYTLTSFAQINSTQAFFDKADIFLKNYVEDKGVRYSDLKDNQELKELINYIAKTDNTQLESSERQAFLINTYNLLVIHAAANAYPLNSLNEIPGFFDAKKHTIGGKSMTLNDLEKKELLKAYGDARFHFVLVCGAKGCPPITNFAYRPEILDQQMDQQTRLALNDPNFIRVNNTISNVGLSRIFEWYPSDFGGSKKSALEFINSYREEKIADDFKINFYPYNWKLNETKTATALSNGANIAANSARYVVSSTRPKGTTETKLFNNLYTQTTGSPDELTDRSTFLTSTLSFLYGLGDRFNAGFDLRYRRVANTALPSSPLDVFGSPTASRQGFTNVGPKVRIAPVPKWSNFSIQSALWIPIGNNLETDPNGVYIDWNKPTFVTQLFNDFTIGTRFSLFTELDFFAEDFGGEAGDSNRFSTPATTILSYFPNPKTTIYALGSYSPFWQSNFDYFYQAGIGAKYQFTPDFEIELLVTDFTSKFLADSGGQAATFNIGFRYTGN